MKRAEAHSDTRFKAAFGTLIGMIITLAIIGILSYILLTQFSAGGFFGKAESQALSEEGVDSSTPQGFIDTTRSKVDALNQKLQERNKQLEY